MLRDRAHFAQRARMRQVDLRHSRLEQVDLRGVIIDDAQVEGLVINGRPIGEILKWMAAGGEGAPPG